MQSERRARVLLNKRSVSFFCLFTLTVYLSFLVISLFINKKGAFMDIVAKCEISRVLLLMLLEVKTRLFSLSILYMNMVI